MQIYWNKRKFLRIKKKVQFPGLVRDSIMAAITLFWDTNMVEITSCENAPGPYICLLYTSDAADE